jgi:hypothetical protein
VAVEGAVKTSLTLTEAELEMLKKLAEESNTTLAEVLRAAIQTEAFLVEAVEDGGRILLEEHDRLRELVVK